MARDNRYDRDWDTGSYRRNREDRGFWNRAGDEMRAWFGDEDAARRRRRDMPSRGRYDYDHDIYGRDFEQGYRYGSGRYGRRFDRDYDRNVRGDYGGGAYYDIDYDWDYNRYYDRDAGRYGYRYSEPDVRGRDIGRDYSGSLYAPDGPHVGRGPQGYQRSDERLVEDASDRLTRHGYLDPSDIRVTAQNGEVTLEGTVDNRRAKRMAEDAVEGVSGVKDVHNHLRVKREAQG